MKWLVALRALVLRVAVLVKRCLVYAAHAWRLAAHRTWESRRDLRRWKLGIVTSEFFHEELGGFGGYGKTVQNLSGALNQEGAGEIADVLITLPPPRGGHIRRYHRANVIFEGQPPFGDKVGSLRSAWSRASYVWLLQRRMIDVLLTIEYYRPYEHFMNELPTTPVVIWLHDPRPMSDWEKIATMSLNVDGAKVGKLDDVAGIQRSLEQVLERSRAIGRKIVFAHQAAFLQVKARTTYQLPSMESVFLPNAVEVPEETVTKAAEPTVCLLGRLDPIKRPWMFFELAKRFPDVTFLVVGRTHFPEVMNPIIERYRGIPNLKFLGMIDGREKDVLLQRCWGLVNTSIHEALPISFLESLAARTAILSCQNPDGITEQFGWYTGEIRGDGFDDESIQPFETALKALLSDRSATLSKGVRGRDFVRQTYSYREFRTRLNAICREL